MYTIKPKKPRPDKVQVKEDLTGKVFGMLTVLRQADDLIEKNGAHVPMWECLCECGNTKIIRGRNLKKKNGTRSCGCATKKFLSLANKKYNKYDLTGEYGIGYLKNNEVFKFDIDIYKQIKNYCWFKDSDGYISTYDTQQNKKLYLHKIVYGCDYSIGVKHIDGDLLNNCRANLAMKYTRTTTNKLINNKEEDDNELQQLA